MNVDTVPAEAADLQQTAIALPEQAAVIEVTTQEEFEFAARWLREVVVALRDQIRSTFRPSIQRAYELHRGLVATERSFLEPIERAEAIVKRTMGDYHAQVERKRLEAEIRARDDREAAELAAKRVAAPAVLAAAVSYAAECMELDRAREEAAASAEKAGDGQVAEALREEIGNHDDVQAPATPQAPLFVEPLPVAAVPEKPKADGATVKVLYGARLADPDACFEAAYRNPALRSLWKFDQTAANQMAKAQRDRLSIPGVELVRESSVAIRRR